MLLLTGNITVKTPINTEYGLTIGYKFVTIYDVVCECRKINDLEFFRRIVN